MQIMKCLTDLNKAVGSGQCTDFTDGSFNDIRSSGYKVLNYRISTQIIGNNMVQSSSGLTSDNLQAFY
jgi:hypothetical protein